MATVLPFVVRPRAAVPRDGTGAASIIIFPGVRYERQPQGQNARSSRNDDAPSKRKTKPH